MWILFAPFSVAFDSSDDNIAILIGDADFGAIWRPFHISNIGCFAVVDHFLNPLSVVFHEDNDGSGGITGGEFTIFFVPDNNTEVACMIG